MCWNDIRWIWLGKIDHHHWLRIILCFWAIRNSGCRLVYWYYDILLLLYTSRMFICGLILHMLFSYLFLFNTTVYGILAHSIFEVCFCLAFLLSLHCHGSIVEPFNIWIFGERRYPYGFWIVIIKFWSKLENNILPNFI